MIDHLVESNKAAVLKYYGKTEEDYKEDIKRIVEWVEKQPHLPEPSEMWIRVLLVRKKFSLERTKEALENYYRLKHLVPEVFSNWDVSNTEIQQAINTCACIPLSKLTPKYEAVSVMKLFNPDINVFNMWESGKVSIMFRVLRMKVEYSISDHLIFDYEGFTISHMTRLTPTFLKKMYTAIMKACNLKVTAFHTLNPPPMFDALLAMLKPIMKPKLYNRIIVHNNLESLYKHVPREILPKEYGGNEPSICELRDLWKKEIENHRDFFLEEEKCNQSDESKRTGKIDDDIFGSMHGSFRKLQID